jgi:hypothetical protein
MSENLSRKPDPKRTPDANHAGNARPVAAVSGKAELLQFAAMIRHSMNNVGRIAEVDAVLAQRRDPSPTQAPECAMIASRFPMSVCVCDVPSRPVRLIPDGRKRVIRLLTALPLAFQQQSWVR